MTLKNIYENGRISVIEFAALGTHLQAGSWASRNLFTGLLAYNVIYQ